MNGKTYVCAEIKDILYDQVFQSETNGTSDQGLTFREIEIIKQIKEGLSSKEISSVLNISVRTVEVHRHNILKKLKQKNTSLPHQFYQ